MGAPGERGPPGALGGQGPQGAPGPRGEAGQQHLKPLVLKVDHGWDAAIDSTHSPLYPLRNHNTSEVGIRECSGD